MEIDATAANHDTFYRSLEQLLNLPAASLQQDQQLRDLKGWDSLAILEVMTLASMDYNSDVEPSDLANCTTVGDLADAVLAARAPAN